MLEHPFAQAVAVAFFCGAVAFTATWLRQRQLTATDPGRRPGTTPLGAGLTAMIGALLGIALIRALTN